MPSLYRSSRLFDGRNFIDSGCLRVSAGGKVLAVGANLEALEDETVVDCGDAWILPGLVDCHVHFREPGLAHKEGWATGSEGALHGGVTTVMEIQNNPPLMENGALMAAKLADLTGKSRVDFAPYGSLTEAALPTLAELRGMCPAVKCFLGCSTGAGGVHDEPTMRRLFAGAAAAGLKIVAHCEDNAIMKAASKAAQQEKQTASEGDGDAPRHDVLRPAEAEIQSIADAIRIAGEEGAVLHVFHISTAEGAHLVAKAASQGAPVTGTTAPHYLLVDAEEAAAAAENRFKVNPSIKSAEDRAGLADLLAKGALQGVGTDHAPHPLQEKGRPYSKAPSGFPSVDLLLPLMFAVADRHDLDLETVLASVTREPANEFGLLQKGRLECGVDADFVLCRPNVLRQVVEKDLPSRSKWSPYHGRSLRGFPEQVFLRGQEVFRHGDFPQEPSGRPLFGS